jgi:hypothetical protein
MDAEPIEFLPEEAEQILRDLTLAAPDMVQGETFDAGSLPAVPALLVVKDLTFAYQSRPRLRVQGRGRVGHAGLSPFLGLEYRSNTLKLLDFGRDSRDIETSGLVSRMGPSEIRGSGHEGAARVRGKPPCLRVLKLDNAPGSAVLVRGAMRGPGHLSITTIDGPFEDTDHEHVERRLVFLRPTREVFVQGGWHPDLKVDNGFRH